MAKELDEIIYDALKANETIVEETGGRIKSTCFEVPPTEDDNTPIPYIIITDDPYQNEMGTKDSVWEGNTDHVQASVIIAADSPASVKRLRRLVRKAIGDYIVENRTGYIYLTAESNDGIQWDWSKPCYYDTIHYSCDMDVNLEDDEQEENTGEATAEA